MARSFNGTSDYINVGSITLGAATPFSVACWFNINALPTGSNLVNMWAINTTGNTFDFYGNGGSPLIRFINGGTQANASTSGLITPGNWYHGACTYSNPNLTIYINGVSAATAAGGGLCSGTFYFGTVDTTQRFFPGAMAEFAAWNTIALTATEVLALARGVRPNVIRPASLVGFWPLFGNQSPEPDLSGNKNNGTLTGTSLAFGPPITQYTPRWPQFPAPPPPPPQFVLMPQIVM
jgi:hypothetical protein